MKYNWRGYEETDRFEVEALKIEQDIAIGAKMDMPPLADHPVLACEIATKDGVVVGGFYFESVPECCFLGRDPAVTVDARLRSVDTLKKLKEYGFRLVRMEVPRSLPESEREMIRAELGLVGFKQTDSENEHYVIDLRPGGALG